MGRAAVHARLRAGQCDSDAGEVVRPGGHAEGLRRRWGEAAGEKLGTAPVNRHVGNVGTLLGSPSLPCAQHGGGQARRRLWALGAGGAALVVRARGSRGQGEGRGGGGGGGGVRGWGGGRGGGARLNPGAPWPTLSIEEAEARVRGIQAKLHRWATQDRTRRFGDLFNLVCDPAFLLVGWRRVRGNKGARSAGVDGETAYYVETVRGEEAFLAELRASLKDRSFRPLPVRERLIPKPGSSKQRRLGIATVRDRGVQAALKLVLEPIWEADFRPCSYGFRPGRRAQDAIAEIHHLASHSYEWVLEGDITACFDEISHTALM